MKNKNRFFKPLCYMYIIGQTKKSYPGPTDYD